MYLRRAGNGGKMMRVEADQPSEQLAGDRGSSRAARFLWGVATSAYQSEGGMNAGGRLRTNWAAAEEAGKVEPVGEAAGFWERHREDFARCQSLGLNAFRLGLSWTRLQPTRQHGIDGRVDERAAQGYADMLAACRDAGLEPIVTLHHFTHPEWMGSDPWLDPDSAQLFASFAAAALAAVNKRLSDGYGHAPLHWLITINEPNMLVLNSYIGSQFPARGGRGFLVSHRAYNMLLRAHVRAYGAIHALYRREGWRTPRLAFNNYCSDLYWSDKLLLDLVSYRERGVPRGSLHNYICEKCEAFSEAFATARIRMHKDVPYYFGRVFKAFVDMVGRKTFLPSVFNPLLDEIERAPEDGFLDYIGIDYYDPFMAHLFRLPRFGDYRQGDTSLRAWMMNSVTSKWWDWRVLPQGLDFFCTYYSSDFGGRDILIAENGMAINRERDNTLHARRDGMTRSQFLRLHVHEVCRLVSRGVPIVGYLHWSLFDNYEWGSYSPRFGLYSIDYTTGLDRLATDPSGDTPAATYAKLISEARRTVCHLDKSNADSD